MRRHARLGLELIGGLFALVALLAAAAALILTSGSVELDFLAPLLAASLSNPASDVQVTIAQARMTLTEGPRLEIVARGVELRVGAAGPQIALPELAVDLSVRAMLRGVIAPTRITLDQPQLRLARDEGGEFHLGFDGAGDRPTEASLGQVLRDLSGPPDPRAPVGALTELTIRRAGFVFDDRALGVVWRASADLTLHRDERGLRGDVSLSDNGARPAAIRAEIDYVRAAARVEARVDFRNLLPSSWAAASAAMTPLGALDLPVSGTVRATLDPDRGAIIAASCDLQLGAGKWRDAAMQGGSLAIADGAIVASYDPGNGRIILTNFALGLAGPSLVARGTIDGAGGGLLAGGWPRVFDAALVLDTSDVPIAALPTLWPQALSPHARHWVLANVHDGTVESATAQLGVHVDLDAPEAVALRKLTGKLAYRDLVVDTLGKLPQVREVGGTGTFDLATMNLAPTSGTLLGLRISDAKIALTRLDIPESRAALDLTLAGPLRDALTLLDSEPLGYTRTLGLSPAEVAGDVSARVTLAFPLIDRVELRQVSVAVDAALSGVAVPHAALGRDVSAGAFKMRLDRGVLALDGTASLARVPVTVGVIYSLADNPAERVRATVHARPDSKDRRALGIDFFPDMVTGPVGIDLAYKATAATTAEAQVSLDFHDSGLTIAPLSWSKLAGSNASARLALKLTGEHVLAVRDLVFSGGGLEAKLDASFTDDGGLSRLDVTHLAVGATDASGSILKREDGGWHVAVDGAAFDATGLADLLSHAAPSTGAEPAFDLDVKLDRIILGWQREAHGVRGHLVSDGDHWQTATADATLAGGAPMRLRYGPVAGSRHFSLRSDDFGGLLNLVGIAQNVRGGRIQVTGSAVDEGLQRRLKLTADGDDYRVVNAPMVAKLLSVASFSGILSVLSGDGIPFTRLTATMLYGDDRMVIDDFRTYGGVIGVNANGTVDRQAGTINMTGTLVPSFRLNTVLGDIPRLGNLLLGGAGEGLFGANFAITGSLDNPTTSVNMLSALAPGALRNLFRVSPGRSAPP